MDECRSCRHRSGELYSRRSNTLCVRRWRRYLEATTLITALADKYKQTQTPVIYRLLVRQGLAIAPTVVLASGARRSGEMGIMWSLGTIARISELAEQNKIIAYNYPQGVLHKPYAPPQPTSLVLLVILDRDICRSTPARRQTE